MKRTNLHTTKMHNHKKTRKPGAWAGKVTIKKDFDTLPDDFMKHFKKTN